MTRWITAFTLPLTLLFAACDSEPVDDRGAAIEQAADDEVADADADAEARPDHRRHAPGDKLCAAIECSDEQQAQIAELFAKNRPEKGAFKDRHEAGQEQRKALADAFRAGSLTAEDLRAHHEAKKSEMTKRDPGAMLVELHALLTAEQRGALADMMETRGLHFFGGKHGKHGKHGERGDKFAGGDKPVKDADHAAKREKHAGKRIDKLCSKVECTDEQRATLEAKAAAARDSHIADREANKEAMTASKKALAQAFRGDSFSAADVERFKGSMESMHGAKASDMEAMILDLQALFTAEQRGVLADKIEKHGVGALMGGKHGKRGKHGKGGKDRKGGERGKHGKRGGDWSDAPEAEEGPSDEV
ncbi:MAG: Spy/CpxP family protein refolding chaperone [Nannocystaceae bacterium]